MYSLRRRVLISSTLLLLLFLGIMGFGLNRAFERSVLTAAQDALRNQVLLLMSAVDVLGDQIELPSVFSEPRLSQPDSGLFAQFYAGATPKEQSVIWRSPSLLEQTLPITPSQLGEFNFYSSQAWQGRSLNITTLSVEWETSNGMVPFVVQVAETDLAYKRRLAGYQRQVGLWLAVFGGALIVLLLGILGWSLKPLERVRKQVNQIENGERRRFDEDYPAEVSRLTQNLNQLLQFEEQRIERQKEVLGNLAHSLKTPIAVLKGLRYSAENHTEAAEQLSIMQTIIDYQLQSASAVGRRRFARAIDINDITEKIVRSLKKLHSEKGLDVLVELERGAVFYGDPGDWMEVVGNLCDNAFKWSESKVSIKVENLQGTESQKRSVRIIVQDDGAGIESKLKHSILQRGVRLDSQTPGHGLGMHIVKGVVDAYAGTLAIDDADFGRGTKFTVVLS